MPLPKLNSSRSFDEIKKKNTHVLETRVVCSMKKFAIKITRNMILRTICRRLIEGTTDPNAILQLYGSVPCAVKACAWVNARTSATVRVTRSPVIALPFSAHANQCTILPSTVVNVPFDWSALRCVRDRGERSIVSATINPAIENSLVSEASSFFANLEWRAFILFDLGLAASDFRNDLIFRRNKEIKHVHVFQFKI